MPEDGKTKSDTDMSNIHTHVEWVNSNEDHYTAADTSRYRSQKVRNEAVLLIGDCQGQTDRWA